MHETGLRYRNISLYVTRSLQTNRLQNLNPEKNDLPTSAENLCCTRIVLLLRPCDCWAPLTLGSVFPALNNTRRVQVSDTEQLLAATAGWVSATDKKTIEMGHSSSPSAFSEDLTRQQLPFLATVEGAAGEKAIWPKHTHTHTQSVTLWSWLAYWTEHTQRGLSLVYIWTDRQWELSCGCHSDTGTHMHAHQMRSAA